jgi:galactokinase
VAGARMMGGGFGGCTINIVQANKVEAFTSRIQQAFAARFGKTPDVYVTQVEEGTRVV